jgi:cell division protein FtsL
MAINVERFSPLNQARARRQEMTRYLKLDGSRYLMVVVILLGLMSMIALVQTGVVATKGYAIVELETQRATLLRENSDLELRMAAAQSLGRVRARAEELGLRPVTDEQIRYITIEALPAAQDIETAQQEHETTAPPDTELTGQ